MASVTLVLAFGFAAPWLLWGIALAAAPVVIHLLFRRQFRETPWAAMQFLVAASQRQSRWSRIDQWLLLLVRTLIPLAAAIALAGPLLDLATGASTSTPTHRVLVLDVSLSTQAREAGRSHWSRIRDAATALAGEARPGDTWQLYVMGGAAPRAVIAEPTFLSDPLLEELRQLEASAETGRFADTLGQVVESLQKQAPGRRAVYLMTDGQRAQWRPQSEAEREQLQTTLAELHKLARVVWVDVTTSSLGNVAVTDVSLGEPYVLAGQGVRASATVTRYGDAPWPKTLEWRVDGRLVAAQPLDDPQGNEIRRELQYTPPAAGEIRIEAALPADALTGDDRRGAVCVVRDQVRVLLVDGRPSGVPFENATDAVRLALAPDASIPGQILATVVSDGDLLSASLEDFDVVWLCDVPRLTEREAELLGRYTRDGGGLVISLGPGVREETYNAALLDDSAPLLPARIGDLVGDARRRDQSFAFRGDDFSHPILAPFRGNPNTGFELTQTFAYRKTFPTPNARVAVAFETGDPAIVEGKFGRGRVLLITTAADRTWGTWAVWGHTFVPMLHETIRHLLSSQLESRQLEVGKTLLAALPRSQLSGVVQVLTPQDERKPAEAIDPAGSTTIAFSETTTPGFYAVDPPGTAIPSLWFAVNPNPRESDLTPLSASELRDGLFAGRPVDTPADIPSGDTPAAAPLDSPRDDPLPRWLLGFVLILLIGEPFLAWNRSLGLAIAAGLLLTACAGFWGGNLAAAIAATGAAAAGVAMFGRQLWSPAADAPAVSRERA